MTVLLDTCFKKLHKMHVGLEKQFFIIHVYFMAHESPT